MKTIFYSLCAVTLWAVASAQGQGLFSFETGQDGWIVSGFNARPVTLGTSTVGATAGSRSLTISQTGDGFSWNALRNSSGQDAFYNAMNSAAADESLWMLEFDVTYRDADIPNGTFLNLSLWMNSDNTFRDIHSQGFTTTAEDRSVHMAIPLNSFSGTDELAVNSSFYQLGIGMNGNWGAGAATIHVDNFALSPVPEPSAVALLAVGGCLGVALLRRRKGAR